MSERLLDAAEVAARLNVKKSTVYSWVFKRVVPYVKLPGGRALRFREADVSRMIEDGVHEAEEINIEIRP